MFVVGIIGILSAVAAPALSRTKMAANESSAIASLRTINSSQQTFWATCGSGNYSPSLQNLGLPVAGAHGFRRARAVRAGARRQERVRNRDGHRQPRDRHELQRRRGRHDLPRDGGPSAGQGRRFFGTNGGGAIFQSFATLFTDMPDSGAPPAPAMPVQQ